MRAQISKGFIAGLNHRRLAVEPENEGFTFKRTEHDHKSTVLLDVRDGLNPATGDIQVRYGFIVYDDKTIHPFG